MPKPIKLHVVKKTKVPTKPGSTVHQYRSDWVVKDKISYMESETIFKCLNGNIENEAQFCKYIRDKYGIGIYYFRVWKKGQEGFRNFLMVEIRSNRFRRVKPSLRKTEMQKRNIKQDIEELEEKRKKESGDEREIIEMEIEIAQEDLEDLKGNTTKTTRYPYPYLKSSIPVYSWHTYESIEEDDIEQREMRIM